MFYFVHKWAEFKAKMAHIETFNLNENLLLDYDDNVFGLLIWNWVHLRIHGCQ